MTLTNQCNKLWLEAAKIMATLTQRQDNNQLQESPTVTLVSPIYQDREVGRELSPLPKQGSTNSNSQQLVTK